MQELIFLGNMIEPKAGILNLSVIFVIALAAAACLFSLFVLAKSKDTTLALTNDELIIKSSVFTKKIPLENISIDEIRKIDLNENGENHLALRTFGIGMPNMSLGWFRMKDKTKALAFVTDKKNVALIPTKEYLVLFSMNNIEEFISKIKAVKKG
jgi:hypothetical protein